MTHITHKNEKAFPPPQNHRWCMHAMGAMSTRKARAPAATGARRTYKNYFGSLGPDCSSGLFNVRGADLQKRSIAPARRHGVS